MNLHRPSSRCRDERGAYLILWMLMLTALLVMVAIVIDLGGVRSSRREAQRTSDLAAIAAGHRMAAGDVIGACRAAVNYVRSNTSLSSLAETCGTDLAGACNEANPAIMTTTSGRFVFRVQWPVLDSTIEDPAYAINPVTGTRVLPEDGKACERMRVSVEEVNDALFAGVIGVNDLTARSSSVVRGFIGTNPTQNAGLVVLERRGCEAIVATGQGNVLVKGSIALDGSPRPGIIQVDTKALIGGAGLCSNAGGDIPAKYAVFGTNLPSTTDPSIEAEAIGGVPGRLDMYALAINPTGNPAYDVPGNGIRPAPTPGVIASRNVVDKVYNAGAPGRVSALKTSSSSLLTSLASAVAAAPCLGTCNAVQGNDGLIYPVYPPGTPGGPDVNGVTPLVTTSGTAACVSTDATPIEVPASYLRVYVNCAALNVVKIRFANERIVLRGELQIGSNRVAAFPNASEVIVGGCGTCSGGSAAGISASGALLVNSGFDTAPLVPTCSDGADNDTDGRTDYNADATVGDSGCLNAADWDERSCLQDRAAADPSRLVVNTGPIRTSSSSVVQLCQTFVLMADGGSLPNQDVSAATDPTCAGDVDISGAFVPQPCPRTDASYKGFLSVFGTIDWIAPNQNTGRRNTTLANEYFEDLALWTETSTTSEVKGEGNSITGGVYFFPNATFEFSGQASQLIDLNAQFLARRLLLSGQGRLAMQPNPNDTVDTPAPFFKLIR